jgi:RNA polymerase sigma-32 factor
MQRFKQSAFGDMMRSPIPANIARALRRTPSLSATEERDLFRKVHTGDTRARERLVLSQLRYVIRIAGRYRRYGCPLSDLIQEGTVGLLEAIKRFNPEKGNRLSTFAMWWIRASIQDYVLRSGSVVRSVTTPRHRTMYFSGALAGLDEKGGDAVRALASRLNTTVDDVRSFAQRLTAPDHPLDAPRADGSTLADTLPASAPDAETALSSKRERMALVGMLRAALPALTRRERHILRRRFLGEKRQSLTKIGRELGLSKERVRQLEMRALEKIRSGTMGMQAAD